jgi:penicillin-binding protein 1C
MIPNIIKTVQAWLLPPNARPVIIARRMLIASFACLAAALALLLIMAFVNSLFFIRLCAHHPSAHLLDRSYTFIAALENDKGEFGYWPVTGTIPKTLRVMTLAAEDRRFDRHFGVDARSVARACAGNYVLRRGYSGASTIAMQVARMQRGGTTGWWYGKLVDTFDALWITALFGRNRVLGHYLTIAPYGNRINGAACAARRYFNKPLIDLSCAEAALLAAVPRRPGRMNLFTYRGTVNARRRARLILKRAFSYGWITEVQLKESVLELQSFVPVRKQLREASCYHAILAIHNLLDTKAISATGEIRTSLNCDIQDTVQGVLNAHAQRLYDRGANNAAAMVLDAATGEVLAYIGSPDYYGPSGGSIDCAGLPRSTGSALKPFIYEMGMEWRGYTAASVLTDLGFDFGAGRRSFIPENSDRKYLGPVLYKNALANSRNIPAVQVLREVGVDMFYRMCIRLGLARDDGKASYYGLGLSIGGLYCSLRQVCGAYLTLANCGAETKLQWLKQDPVDTATAHQSVCRLMQPDIAMEIRRYLSDPLARLPTFARGGNLEYPFAVAVKTGTSEGFRDAWCIAWSDRYLVGVWTGNTDNTPTKTLSGYEGAAPIAKAIMMRLNPEKTGGLSDNEFAPPPGYIPVRICCLSGKLADTFTPYTTTEYFKPGTEPREYSAVRQKIAIDKRNGLLACDECGRNNIQYRRFTLLPQEFTEWAEAQGLEVPPRHYSPFCAGQQQTAGSYAITISAPRTGSRLFLDPEMPPGKSVLTLACKVSPAPGTVLWIIDDKEFVNADPPYRINWQMRVGMHTFQAVVPETKSKSGVVRVEVF